MKGYLVKRAMKSGRNWKTRYFVLNDDMHNRVFNRFWQAANAPSSHKAKRGLQKYFREIENFCNLNPEARLAAVSGLSILNE